jgi:hypothetical protein
MTLQKSKYEEGFLKKFPYWVFGIGIFAMFSFINDNFRSIPFVFILGLLGWAFLFVCILPTLVLGIIRRKYFVYKWMILPMFCVICITSMGPLRSLGSKLRDFEFKKRVNDYVSVVNNFREGKISTRPPFDEIDMKEVGILPSTVWGVSAYRCSDKGVIVLFKTAIPRGNGGDKGLVYIDNDEMRCFKEILPSVILLHPILPNWYRYRF